MIEVLVAVVILLFGLLSLAALQSRLHLSQLEAYQRAQAVILLNDMSSRMATNRRYASNYVTTSPLGASMVCPTSTATQKDIDLNEWCSALQGSAETSVSGTTLMGAMIGARGCIEAVGAPGSNEYLLTVAWQGMTPISAPPTTIECGKNSYDDTSSSCAGDKCRRVVTTRLKIARLN